MRTRLLAPFLLALALAAGCGDEPVPTTDPGHREPPSADPSTPVPSPGSTPSASPSHTTPPVGVGRAFRAFARGAPPPPVADRVELYLGNALTGVLTRPQARDRSAWATCTELGSYAGATCPLSPLTVLRRHAEVDYQPRPLGLCMPRYGPVPPDLRALDRIVIVPAPGSAETCAQNFAIQLFSDEDGRLVAVSTLLGEP